MIKASQIHLDGNLKEMAESYTNILEHTSLKDGINFDLIQTFKSPPIEIPDVPPIYIDCLSKAPQTIYDLQDGTLTRTLEFSKGDESKLSLMGFVGLTLSHREKVTVVEYMQYGSVLCEGKLLRYGIGCRMMLRIKEYKRGAKLNTPQQITASVIFDKAEVTYSMRTVGITGPGIASLNNAGNMSEDTYTNFMTEVSKLIVDIYSKKSTYIIKPQPLFL
jgi:hypothetical protein